MVRYIASKKSNFRNIRFLKFFLGELGKKIATIKTKSKEKNSTMQVSVYTALLKVWLRLIEYSSNAVKFYCRLKSRQTDMAEDLYRDDWLQEAIKF